MPRSCALATLLATALLGCGGSGSSKPSGDGFHPAPSGGGGTVAEYVGDYAGDGYSVPGAGVSAGTSHHTAKLTLAVVADGTVGGTFMPDGGAATSVTGTVSDQGVVRLSNDYAGAFAKRADGGLAGTLVAPSGFEGYDVVYFRLAGGTAVAAPAPRTTGLIFGGASGGTVSLSGKWYQPANGTTSAVRLKVSPKGHLTGGWTRADGRVGTVDGALYDTVAASSSFAGKATVRFSDGSAVALDLRAQNVTSLPDLGVLYVVGSAVQTDGTADYALYLNAL